MTPGEVHEALRTRRLELIGPDGKLAALLKTSEDGTALFLNTPDGGVLTVSARNGEVVLSYQTREESLAGARPCLKVGVDRLGPYFFHQGNRLPLPPPSQAPMRNEWGL